MANKNDLFDFDETTSSNNDNVQGANIAENCAPSGINNAIRGLASIVKRAVGSQGNAIASAATTAIGAPGTALYAAITGTATITGLGIVGAGTFRIVEFGGALTLTHNPTSLRLPGGADIATAAGDIGFFISLGSGNWKCLHYSRADGTPIAVSANQIPNQAITYGKIQNVTASPRLLGRASAGAGTVQEISIGSGLSMSGSTLGADDNFSTRLLHVRDEKTSGTDGGTSTTGAWSARTLNTVKTNEIAGASVAANTITLPSGTYYIEAWSTLFRDGGAKVRLRNMSDNNTAVVGVSVYGNNGGAYTQSYPKLSGRFTVSGGPKSFTLQYYVSTGLATTGLGNSVGSGEVEVYTEVMIWKVQ